MRWLAVMLALLATLVPSVLLFPSSAQAQQTPTQVVQSAFDAVANRDWHRLSEVIDSTRFRKFRDSNLGLLVEWAQRRDEIAASEHGFGLSGIDSLTPQMIAGVKDVRLPAFGQTIGSLATLSPQEFFIRWSAAQDRNRRSPIQRSSETKRELVGELKIGDTLAYVIYRQEMRTVWDSVLYSDLPGRPEVMPLTRSSGRWKLLLNDDVGRGDIFSLLPLPDPVPHWDDSKLRRETRRTPAPALAPGATAPKRGPAQVAAAAFDAFTRADWEALAALVHPTMLARFQREEMDLIVGWAQEKRSGSPEMAGGIHVMLHPPDEDSSSVAVGEPLAGVRVPLFPDSATIGQLAGATPAQFFVMWCEAVYGHPADTGWARYNGSRRILGEVGEGETLAHVLYTGGPFQYDDPWRVTRMPLARTEDDWGLLFNDDIGERTILGLRLMMLDHPEIAGEPPR
jgi:hypothetical protein